MIYALSSFRDVFSYLRNAVGEIGACFALTGTKVMYLITLSKNVLLTAYGLRISRLMQLISCSHSTFPSLQALKHTTGGIPIEWP